MLIEIMQVLVRDSVQSSKKSFQRLSIPLHRKIGDNESSCLGLCEPRDELASYIFQYFVNYFFLDIFKQKNIFRKKYLNICLKDSRFGHLQSIS